MALDFNLISEFQTIHRRPFELADPTILNPVNANPLVLGEYLQLDAAYKMARGGEAAGATVPSFCYFAEQGRYETQAIQKGPFLYGGFYEADTKVFDGTGITTVGQPLAVGDVTYGSLTRRGILLNPGGGVLTLGYVTRLPANNNGFLRFIRAAF